MLTILGLFGRSPFVSLNAHMDAVSHCVHLLPSIYEALLKGDFTLLEELGAKVSILEHDADLIKNDIRNNLPKGLFLPIDRQSLLNMLSLQDSIADRVEDVGVLLSLKKLELLPIFKEEFKLFLDKNIETFDQVHLIIREFHELVESSFGGIEANKVCGMVDEVAYKEHEVDILQRVLLKKLFEAEDQLTYVTFFLWQRLFQSIASISNLSENLAYKIRTTLELK
jgi:hypothetical protein